MNAPAIPIVSFGHTPPEELSQLDEIPITTRRLNGRRNSRQLPFDVNRHRRYAEILISVRRS